jgi:hypothetical protein
LNLQFKLVELLLLEFDEEEDDVGEECETEKTSGGAGTSETIKFLAPDGFRIWILQHPEM